MNIWDYLDRRGERRAQWRSMRPLRQRILPSDFRGWLGLGLFLQTCGLFGLLAAIPGLQESQGFMTLASAVIVTGWIGGAAAYAYAAGKRDAEQQEQMRQTLTLASDAVNRRNEGDGTAAAAERAEDFEGER